jgi:hypothetical protein
MALFYILFGDVLNMGAYEQLYLVLKQNGKWVLPHTSGLVPELSFMAFARTYIDAAFDIESSSLATGPVDFTSAAPVMHLPGQLRVRVCVCVCVVFSSVRLRVCVFESILVADIGYDTHHSSLELEGVARSSVCVCVVFRRVHLRACVCV